MFRVLAILLSLPRAHGGFAHSRVMAADSSSLELLPDPDTYVVCRFNEGETGDRRACEEAYPDWICGLSSRSSRAVAFIFCRDNFIGILGG